MPGEPPWYRTQRGLLVVAVYAVLTLYALAASIEPRLIGTETLYVNASTADPATEIPAGVYLYAFLGAMAYTFTSVIAKFERGVTGVLRVGLRALAALPLAAGVYLLAGVLQLPTARGSVIAGVAFLVGLYVNLTLKALGGLADRLYGRAPSYGRGTEDSSEGSD